MYMLMDIVKNLKGYKMIFQRECYFNFQIVNIIINDKRYSKDEGF